MSNRDERLDRVERDLNAARRERSKYEELPEDEELEISDEDRAAGIIRRVRHTACRLENGEYFRIQRIIHGPKSSTPPGV